MGIEEENEIVTQAPEGKSEEAAPAAAESSPGGTASAASETPEAPAYQPTYKFKAYDKEHEFDEFLRPAIKDAEAEKKVRELYEKAYGLDHYKGRNQGLEKVINEEYRPLRSQLEEIGKFYQAKDFDTVFEKLGWSQKDIFNWVAKKIQYEDLPPEQKQAYDEARLARLHASKLEADNHRLSEQVTTREVQARTFELDQSLARTEVKPLQEAWDSVYGAGSFRQEVVNTGQFEAATSGKDLSVSDAISRVVARVKPLVERLGSGHASQQNNQPPVRVIPNPQGKGIGAAKKTIKSLADIKRIADSM